MSENGDVKRISEHNSQQFDQNFKALISDAEILPRVIGWMFEDLKDVPIERIKDSLDIIEDGNVVRGRLTESTSVEHGKVIYDTLFDIHATKFGEDMDWILDIEGQGRRTTDLEERMQYYVARMTSDQKQQIFSNKDYGMMSKCISAWIVMNPRLEQRDTVIIYEFAGRYQSGCGCDYPIKPCRNMEIIVINLGQNGEQKSKILGFLDLLFKKDIPVNERRDLLEADYSISLNENLMSKVNDMSESLGQEFLEGLKESQYDDGFYAGKAEGRAEGKEEGRAEGKAEGRAEAAIEHEARSVSLIMSKTGMNVTEAIEYMDVEERLRPLVKEKILQSFE